MTARLTRMVLALVLPAAAAGWLLVAGCDTDSASQDITVSPSSVVLRPGQTVEFTASGGYDYTWSLDPDDGSGRLDTRKGPTVTYTCLATNIGTAPKKVVATSTIEGTSTGNTTTSTTTSNTTTTTSYKEVGFGEVYY